MSPLPVTLSSDELRAAARLVGRAPLPAFATGWKPAESTAADTVALRTLLARGLAGIVSPAGVAGTVSLTQPARSALAPLLTPDQLVEVTVEGREGRRRHLAAGLDGRRVRRGCIGTRRRRVGRGSLRRGRASRRSRQNRGTCWS